GLPHSGQIQSVSNPAAIFQLQPYTTNNDLLLTDNTTPRTLTLVTPSAFQSLNVLDVSGNGTSTYNMTLNFSDKSTDTIAAAMTVPNTSTSGGASGFLGAMNRSTTNPNYNAATGDFFEQDYPLSATDQTKTLVSVTFT